MPASAEQLSLELVAAVSPAVNLRDAYQKLLATCRTAARAEAGAILRVRPVQGTIEMLAGDGKTVRGEYLFSSFIANPKVVGAQVSRDAATFLFDGSVVAANLEIPSTTASRVVLHLEWEHPEYMALETLKALRDALGHVAPLLDHFRRLDSRISILPGRTPEVGLEEIDLELDTPSFPELFKRLYLLLAGRARLEACVFFLRDGAEAVLEPGAVFGRTGQLPKRIRRGSEFEFVLDAMARPAIVEVETGPPEWRGAIFLPFQIKNEAFGGALLRAAEPPRESEIRAWAELLDTASLFAQKALLYRATKAAGAVPPLLLVGIPREVFYLAESYSDADAPLLVQGETGTGKESVARYVHMISRRRDGPFLAFNCAELVESLAESQLFGHVRGAFTGATHDAVGIFEQAHGGTLFLDEIHQLSAPLQAKFLRAIETGEIRPVGSSGPPRGADVRVIVATNQRLEDLVEQGRFLHDLVMRLNVLEIQLPPLRENRRAIIKIASALLAEVCARYRKTIDGFTPRARQSLLRHDYPGNIRELKNIIEKAVLVTAGTQIDVDALPRKLVDTPAPQPGSEEESSWDFESHKTTMERQYLVRLMTHVQGNVAEAARLAGIHRTHIYNLLKKHGLTADIFKP